MNKKKEKMTDNEIMLFNELLMSKINKRKKQPLEILEIVYSEIYCKIHRIKLIHKKIIINIKTLIEIGYCYKCNKEYTEYSDINPIYISNYEHIINELNKS